MIKKIYDHEYWYPGINSWWNKWQVNRKRAVLAKFDYSRLVNFAIEMDDGIIYRPRIHMQNDFLMKKSFIFIRLNGLSKLFPDHHYKYCEKPLRKNHSLILAKVKPSLSSIGTIPVIYDE